MEQTITDQYPIMKLLKKAGLKIPIVFLTGCKMYVDKQTKTITGEAMNSMDMQRYDMTRAFMFSSLEAMKPWIEEINQFCTCLAMRSIRCGLNEPWIVVRGIPFNINKMKTLDQIKNDIKEIK